MTDSVTMTWQVRETHRRKFTPEMWAKFVTSLDINDEHNLSPEPTAESVAAVEEYLNSEDWYADEVMGDMHSPNTWLESDDSGHEVELKVSTA